MKIVMQELYHTFCVCIIHYHFKLMLCNVLFCFRKAIQAVSSKIAQMLAVTLSS